MTNSAINTARVPTDRVPTDEQVLEALRRAWFPIIRSQDIDQGPQAAMLLGERLVAFRSEDGSPAVLQEHCPHRGACLSMGRVVGNAVQCPYHGWQWRAGDGRCVEIPSLGDPSRIPRRAVARAYPAVERFGLVWTALEDPVFGIPDPPELDHENWKFGVSEALPTPAGIRATVENFRDVAHFPFVHYKTMGQIPAVVEPLDVRREGVEIFLDRMYYASGGNEEVWHDMHFVYHAYAPAFICLTYTSPKEGSRYVLHAPCPRGDGDTHVYFVTGPGSDWTGPGVDDLVEQERLVYMEDMPIISELHPLEASLAVPPASTGAHSPADKYTLEYRRAFASFVWAVLEPEVDPRMTEQAVGH